MDSCQQEDGEGHIQNSIAGDPVAEKNHEVLKRVAGEDKAEALRQRMETFKVDVVLQKESEGENNSVTACQIALNLLPRFLRNVNYSGSPEILDVFPPSHKTKISMGEVRPKSDMTLVFGKLPRKGSHNLYVSSGGWSIYLSRRNPCPWNTKHVNVIAAMYAGAMAVGEAYKSMLGDSVRNEPVDSAFQYDLVTHGSTQKHPVLEPSIPGMLHFQTLTLVGCGAIGQAFTYALALSTKIMGNVTLIDRDKMDISNEQRYLLGFLEHRGMTKVEILKNLLLQSRTPLRITSLTLNYEMLGLGIEAIPLGSEVVAAVDNKETRINLQAALPKTLWNAWTDVSEGSLRYGVGRHVLDGKYECMACSYFPDGDSPTEIRMASLRTGIPEQEIVSRLASEDMITQEDVERICRHNGTALANLQPNVGKPFREILHGECGVFRLPFPQRHEPTPAPHQPALAGILAASQVILSRLRLPDAAKPVESSSDFDALILPRDGCIMIQLPNERCFCNDPEYGSTYLERWKMP